MNIAELGKAVGYATGFNGFFSDVVSDGSTFMVSLGERIESEMRVRKGLVSGK